MASRDAGVGAQRSSPATLVRQTRKGDPQATRLLAERACTLALRTAVAVMGSHEQALDVSQDVAVDVVKSLDRLRDPEAFDAWVHRITTRHARRTLRRQALRRRREQPILLADGGTIVGEASAAAAEEAPVADRLAARSALAAALAELPPRQRIVIALRYVHDLSDAEIADALDCREGTVHALLSRARAALRSSHQLDELRPAIQGGGR